MAGIEAAGVAAARNGFPREVIISIANLHKIYDTGEVKVHALRGIDFEVARGEALYRMRDNSRTDFRASNMGFIFQTFNLLPVLTVAENVELPALVAGVKPGEARKRALRYVDAIRLGDQAGKRPAEISGGQQQRVAIARALVNDPAIVWCDEPTGNLDSENQDQIMDLLCNLNKDHGQTFVLVTHSNEVGARADRIVHMRDGVIEHDLKNGRQTPPASSGGELQAP